MDWELVYDADGATPGQDVEAVLDGIAGSGLTDLFVFSHGWNTDQQGARGLYGALFGLLRDAATAGVGTNAATTGFLGVVWPSIWFPETAATVPGGHGSGQAGDGPAVRARSGSDELSGEQIAATMRDGFSGSERDTVERLGQLIDEGVAAAAAGEPESDQQQRLEQFHQGLLSLVTTDPAAAPEDAGELALLLTDDPTAAYRSLAEQFGTVGGGSSGQSFGDLLGTAFQGAKDALRLLSYNTMKARAGVVGRNGLGPHLARLHQKDPALRVHLMGHSFGARLVSYALSGLGDAADSPVQSLLLIQGAFSHFSFARALDNPFGEPGALHEFGDRVHGARAATFSVHDRAVGFWYPKASFLAGQSAQASGAPDKWGGMGADGYQAVVPLVGRVLATDGGLDGDVPVEGYVGVDAQNVIADESQSLFAGAHSDIRHPAVARLAMAVATAAAPADHTG